MDHKKTQSLTLPAASVPFGRLLLTVGLICALFVAWIGFVSALFSQSYQMGIWPALLISLPLMTLAGAMGWASIRLWRGGFGQPRPRVLCALVVALCLCLSLWSLFLDPGDALSTVPVLGFVGLVFGLMAAIGPRRAAKG